MARRHYARQDTKTPLYISIFLDYFEYYFSNRLSMVTAGAYGLAWAQSTVAVLEVVVHGGYESSNAKYSTLTLCGRFLKMIITGNRANYAVSLS